MFRKVVRVLQALTQCISAFGVEMSEGEPGDRPPSQTNEDRVRVLSLIIERAEARIAFQSRDIDSHDTKALAFIAVDLAGAGVLVGVRDSLQPWWWVPLIGLGISAAFFASTLWPRLFDSGPNLRQFYETWGGSTVVDVHRQMMGEMLDAIDKNRRILPGKERAFNVGAVVLAVTIAVGSVFLRVSTTTDHPRPSTRRTVPRSTMGRKLQHTEGRSTLVAQTAIARRAPTIRPSVPGESERIDREDAEQ